MHILYFEVYNFYIVNTRNSDVWNDSTGINQQNLECAELCDTESLGFPQKENVERGNINFRDLKHKPNLMCGLFDPDFFK